MIIENVITFCKHSKYFYAKAMKSNNTNLLADDINRKNPLSNILMGVIKN